MKIDEYKPTEKDWGYILKVMIKYNRQSGWIDVVEDEKGSYRLEFFDSYVRLGDAGAMYVTIEEVLGYLMGLKSAL